MKIKKQNLDLIKSGKLEGSKFFAFKRLLEKKGVEVSNSYLNGAKCIPIGKGEYLGAKYNVIVGVYKVNYFTLKEV